MRFDAMSADAVGGTCRNAVQNERVRAVDKHAREDPTHVVRCVLPCVDKAVKVKEAAKCWVNLQSRQNEEGVRKNLQHIHKNVKRA